MEIGELFSGKKIRLHLIAGVILALSGCSSSPEAISAKHLAAGKALLEKKDAARAVLEFKTAAQDTPNDPDALHALAFTEMKLGDPKDAMQHLEQAIRAAPQQVALAATLAET